MEISCAYCGLSVHAVYFWNAIVLQEKSQSGVRKLNPNQECFKLVCGFVATSCILIFAVPGHKTINIPEMFQVFMVYWSHCKGSGT